MCVYITDIIIINLVDFLKIVSDLLLMCDYPSN